MQCRKCLAVSPPITLELRMWQCDCFLTGKWIKCSDKLPKLGIAYRYLFINGKKEVTFGYAYDPKWDDSKDCVWINDMDRESNEIATHWMQLPEPPEDL